MDTLDANLIERTRALLEPGDIDLRGLIVHTEFTSEHETQLHQLTLDVGEAIATAAGEDDTYVYSGNDDPDFGLNQHQGLRIEDDGFVWECQQLLREGTFDIVFYYERGADQDAIIDAIDNDTVDCTPVEP
ncbi:DUF5778 family protein [Halocatena halophila]|uniref:DUF5778 family protein n=1 Tax=Halocatena halophila TaxID=2814576 RepID=UPI002ED013E3